jgi:putative inorganic carbon (hco3(-)) transporter
MAFLADLSMRHPLLRGRMPLLLLGVLAAALVLGLMMARQPVLAIGAMVAGLLAVAILAWPDVSTLAVIFILYTNAAVVAVRYHGVPDFAGAAVPALLLIPLASYLIFRRQKLIITPVLPLVFFFLVIQVIGTLTAQYIGAATAALMNFIVEGICLYFLITNVVRTPAMLRRVIWVLLIAGTFMGALSVYQQLTHTYHNNYWGFAQMSNAAFGTGGETINGKNLQQRLAGPLGDQNRYAQNMLMLVPLGLFCFWGERSKTLRACAAIATGFCAMGVALTFSRGAAVGFVLMLVVMTFMRYIKPYQIAIIFLGLVLLMAAVPEYRTRLTSLQGLSALASGDGSSTGAEGPDGSILSRATEGLAALLVFVDHPVIGVGPGLFRFYYQDYAEFVGLRVLAADRQAHDLYLGVAAETGALGLLCFMLILFVTLRNLDRARKRWAQSRPEIANMATAFMLAIVTYMTTGIFLHFAYLRFFWLMMALAGTASYIATTNAPEPLAAKAGGDGAPTALQVTGNHVS